MWTAILFILAVLFAIPTAGLSLLAFFVAFFLKNWARGKSRALEADQRRAMRKQMSAVPAQNSIEYDRTQPATAGYISQAPFFNYSMEPDDVEERDFASMLEGEAESFDDAVLLSSANEGALKEVSGVSDVEIEVFFSRHRFYQVAPIEQKDKLATGRAGWLMIDANLYLVAAASIDGCAWVQTAPVAIPHSAMMTISGDHDTSRMQTAQHEWLMEFLPKMRRMADLISEK